jgi:hypothetical protein
LQSKFFFRPNYTLSDSGEVDKAKDLELANMNLKLSSSNAEKNITRFQHGNGKRKEGDFFEYSLVSWRACFELESR